MLVKRKQIICILFLRKFCRHISTQNISKILNGKVTNYLQHLQLRYKMFFIFFLFFVYYF